MGNCEVSSAVTMHIGIYEFKTNNVIGSSQYGVVYKGYPINNHGFSVAIKCLNQPFSEKDFKEVRPTLVKLGAIENPNISKYTDYYHDVANSKLYIISEYFSYGNLNDLLMNELKLDPVEDLRTAITYCQQLISGLLALHKNNIIHGRLNPKNVLVDCRKLKINDFGLYKLYRRDKKRKPKGSVYDAPELFQGLVKPNEKTDIWSLGVIMYHLIYKVNPLKIMAGEHVFYNLLWGKCEVFDDLAKMCLALDPLERISRQDLENHPFLSMDPQKIEYLPGHWRNMRSVDMPSPSPHTAYKMFHQMEIGFNVSHG